MKSGLLWYDADPTTPLDAKINAAAQRYYERFGVKPNICYANAGDLCRFSTGRDPLTYKMPCMVQPNKTILPNHVWLGIVES